MNIEVIAVGKTRSKYVSEGLEIYLKRMKRYISFGLTELTDVKNAGKISQEEQKEAEGVQLLGKITESDYLVLLDERGKQFSSKEFAKRLQGIMASGRKRLVLMIGGPYGFSKAVYNRANELLSLSKMTFNHEMVRLFITEQTYRAMTILKGEPYHHD